MSAKKNIRITEAGSIYQDLDKMNVKSLLQNINKEDQTVPFAIQKVLPKIEKLVEAALKKMQQGGRLFYIGAGTSGRLAIVDASECPPTFGVPYNLVTGIIAGGDKAIRKAVEFAEDNVEQGWIDLLKHKINSKDFLIGIAASGSTPYVISALEKAKLNCIETGSITCNKNSPLSKVAKFAVEVIVGPEFVTGSTRMKSGTAQKLVLNMISTSLMIKLGKVKGNKMVDMRMSNNKLVQRGIQMLMDELDINEKSAGELLKIHGNIRKAIQAQTK
ncbi:MAG: N-acetylmuramic acid 6-phosphate etherase [Bacteroidia bacterium]|nr:N-acetylmuramic acid 6-phosphate etherase [Bacteroidia bacterium]